MKLYSVEATVAATNDFERLRRFTDIVPGTLLIEDPDAPTLVFPVEANSVREAVVFIEGIAVVGELDLVSGHVSVIDEDFHAEDGDESEQDMRLSRGESWRIAVTDHAEEHGLANA